MTLQTLELEKIHLTLASEKLELNVASSVDFRFPSGWNAPQEVDFRFPSGWNAPQEVDSVVDALTGGHVWVSQGRRCRLDIEVSLDGKRLEGISRVSHLESLGHQLREMYLWSQLALLPTLEIPSTHLADSTADLCIYISKDSTLAKPQPKAWLMDNIDIRAPESVLWAEFERIHIRLSFQQIKRISRNIAKRLKPNLPDSDHHEPLLLDDGAGAGKAIWPMLFKEGPVYDNTEPESKADCKDGLKTGEINDLQLEDEMLLSLDDEIPQQREKDKAPSGTTPASKSKPVVVKQGVKNSNFRRETTDRLKNWINTHSGNLYPTTSEKLELMKDTGLQRAQLNGWFSRTRQRLSGKNGSRPVVAKAKPPRYADRTTPLNLPSEESVNKQPITSVHEDGMLFGDSRDHNETEMLFGEYSESDEEDDMLFSQLGSVAPSLISQTSTVSTSSSSICHKRSASDEIAHFDTPSSSLTTLVPKPANKLACVALCSLVAGSSNVSKDLQGTKIRKPQPSVSLSLLVPSIFCPGFKEGMAHNSKFLPTISNTISSSCVRNVQGAGLRLKLIELSNTRISKFHDGDGETRSVERLAAVVQGRMWRVMQKTLYDEGDTRKLWRKKEAANEDTEVLDLDACGDEDLLGESQGGTSSDTDRKFEDYIGEDSEDDDDDLFDDLLKDKDANMSDGDLLGYLEEQERLATEAETDEMLFNSDSHQSAYKDIQKEDVDEEILLLRDGSQEERMLL